MTLTEYKEIYKKVWRYMILIICFLMMPGMIGAAILTSKLADSSSWERPAVFWSMFPTLISPILLSLLLIEWVDSKVGCFCECGQSLTIGKEVRHLLNKGGCCPKCGVEVVVNDEL